MTNAKVVAFERIVDEIDDRIVWVEIHGCPLDKELISMIPEAYGIDKLSQPAFIGQKLIEAIQKDELFELTDLAIYLEGNTLAAGVRITTQFEIQVNDQVKWRGGYPDMQNVDNLTYDKGSPLYRVTSNSLWHLDLLDSNIWLILRKNYRDSYCANFQVNANRHADISSFCFDIEFLDEAGFVISGVTYDGKMDDVEDMGERLLSKEFIFLNKGELIASFYVDGY
jgi:hypothetical protein